MRIQVIISVAVFLAALALIGGCTSPKLCDKGAIGCVCKESNTCNSGGVCIKDRCVSVVGDAAIGAEGGAGTGGGADGGGTGGSAGDSGAAGSGGGGGTGGGAVDSGAEDGGVIQPEDGGTPFDCNGDTSVKVCMTWCQMFCAYQPIYCKTSTCPDVGTFCAANGTGTKSCLSTGTTLKELIATCEQLQSVTCESFGKYCVNDDPVCEVSTEGCKDICEGGDISAVKDGSCDDGGRGSQYSACAYGTDCTDCGPRLLCTDDCASNSDGFCDDGGDTSSGDCSFGSDCSDCGSRDIVCLETCDTDASTTCDDGGPDADYAACDYGTDCADCGPRPLSDCRDMGDDCDADAKCCGQGVTEICADSMCRAVCAENMDCNSQCCYEFTPGRKGCADSSYCG